MSGERVELSKLDLLALDYHGKVTALDAIAQEMLSVQLEYSTLAGRLAELKARIEILKQVKSSLQSSIRAEGVY